MDPTVQTIFVLTDASRWNIRDFFTQPENIPQRDIYIIHEICTRLGNRTFRYGLIPKSKAKANFYTNYIKIMPDVRFFNSHKVSFTAQEKVCFHHTCRYMQCTEYTYIHSCIITYIPPLQLQFSIHFITFQISFIYTSSNHTFASKGKFQANMDKLTDKSF